MLGEIPVPQEALQEPTFQAVHGVPLTLLLNANDRENPIADDRVSIYHISNVGASETVVVFPPVNGLQIYERMLSIAGTPQNLYAIPIDLQQILQKPESGLAQNHVSRMGALWDTYMESAQHQLESYNTASQVKGGLNELDRLKKIFAYQIKGMTPRQVDTVHATANTLTKMLNTEDWDVQTAVLTLGINISDFKESSRRTARFRGLRKYLREVRQGTHDNSLSAAVLDVARSKAEALRTEDGTGWDEGIILDLATKTAPRTNSYSIVSGNNNEFYEIPPLEGDAKTELGKTTTKVGRHIIQLSVNEEGRLQSSIDDDFQKHGEQMTGRLPKTVPIIHIKEANGVVGFEFGENGDNLPESIRTDIQTRTLTEGKPAFISPMVGTAMVVAANPSMRNPEEDAWNAVWKKERITMSEVSGIEWVPFSIPGRENEPDQVHGPLQAGVVALHAFVRNPQTPIEVMERANKLIATTSS